MALEAKGVPRVDQVVRRELGSEHLRTHLLQERSDKTSTIRAVDNRRHARGHLVSDSPGDGGEGGYSDYGDGLHLA